MYVKRSSGKGPVFKLSAAKAKLWCEELNKKNCGTRGLTFHWVTAK